MTFSRLFTPLLFLLFCTSMLFAGGNPGFNRVGTDSGQRWVDSVMNTLTLRERIAQLFMVAAYSNKDQRHVDEIMQLVADERIGGLCFFQGGPVRQALLTNSYQRTAKVPLLISMDAEWGLGMRLDSTLSYPRQMALGAVADTRMMYQVGADIARQLRRLGVHVNFAPVVDINSNPQNPVINSRAFGEGRDLVTQKGLAYMVALQDNGIVACAKHFPGHGDTDTDSHYTLPKINHSYQRLDSIELYPFKKLIENGVSGVMVAHLEVPALEPKEKIAASISPTIISSLLIQQLGFNGLIFTDALNMRGVKDLYKPVELNYLALVAGNDVLVFPSEVKASIDRIEAEVKAKRFPEEEINRRCRKVIETKFKVGLNSFSPVSLEDLVSDLNRPSSQLLIRQAVQKSITVLNNSGVIPIQRLDTLNMAYVEVGNDKGNFFREQLELYGHITSFSINADDSESEFNSLREQIAPYNLIIVGMHSLNSRPSRNYGLTPEILQFLSELAQRQRTIVAVFGLPYILPMFSDLNIFDGLVVAYDNSNIAQSLTGQILFGGAEYEGTLPVNVSDEYHLGRGFESDKRIRLKYSQPEELHISSQNLLKIDSIALDAIARQVAPGMQIVAVHKGVVFYNKTFGSTIYNNGYFLSDSRVLYDVASVTKVAATTPMAMQLFSKGELDMNLPIGNYLAFPDTSRIRKMTIGNIMLHQAGLEAWIPFYQRTLTALYPNQPVYSENFSSEYPFQMAPKRFANRFVSPSPKYYAIDQSASFPTRVARNLYASRSMQDSLFRWILGSKPCPEGKYKYSDLGFIMLRWAMDSISTVKTERWVTDSLYSRMGMNYTTFSPWQHFDSERIAPTENDLIFRRQILTGDVHDPAAAMQGGVSGHAGLFSTANDLAKYMQMLLNGGTYGGDRFFPKTTIDLFTSCVSCKTGNRRGYGFDKPETNPLGRSPVTREASSLSFGHSGFTGALVWADPAYDFIFIFVSNGVYPNGDNSALNKLNVRTKIHEVLYKAVKGAVE